MVNYLHGIMSAKGNSSCKRSLFWLGRGQSYFPSYARTAVYDATSIPIVADESRQSLRMVKLICRKVVFNSEGDELSYFEWISRIRAVSRWEGVGDEIHLYLPRAAIPQKSLRELVALFYRYNIDMRQLA
jgi:hypothetical protein